MNKKIFLFATVLASMVFANVAKAQQAPRITIEQAILTDEEVVKLKNALDTHTANELGLFPSDSLTFRQLLNNGNDVLEGGIAEDGLFVAKSKYGDSWSAFICREHGGYCLFYEITDGETYRCLGGCLTEAIKPDEK